MDIDNHKTHGYPEADAFFQSNWPTGLTYDDVSLATNYSDIIPKQAELDVRLAEKIALHLPIISSDMDTVTESKMAITMALHGGMGLIHYNMPEKNQVKEVARVKNHIHGLIQDPILVSPDVYIQDVLDMIEERQFDFRSFPVVDEKRKLLGFLPSRVIRSRYKGKKVSEAMISREDVFTLTTKELGRNPITVADEFFTANMGIHKLLVVDHEDKLCGLLTLSDIERIVEESTAKIKPARDGDFRLLCGAAVATHRNLDGSLDKERILNHVSLLVKEGVDVIAVSTAHGHTAGVGDSVRLLREQFKDLTIIAGNVTSAEGVEFLADCGANVIKIGQGPGSICTTRIVAGVGIPQLSALYYAAQGAKKKGVQILADGGITKSGDMVKALTLADAVICGGLLAGCLEAPGKVIEIDGKLYKEYRGMGSHEAMKEGSAARYGHIQKDTSRKVAAEGISALKEVGTSASEILTQLSGGIQSGMGYLGARNLVELKEKARYIRVTQAGYLESRPHNVIEIKSNPTAK
ncbi:MAG: malate dehydrogenase [Verrucomicrobia bacterium CG_4_10_14_3_um_filter_43_23]|nr:MAG: malate dehydrogenase [Verrucomicrobia bacterium CG22_combo_CG10-13_8_21_14_all_43_17]PIX57666.1 MAG: malate dehydrogenase [Verrucomicrobia bacterium CG_4_10_14_3_um_filter_43_23]PIY61801.1 MAG: malate dehydrogenase [Verrucomicrobia bacterium CG_4_10_14_0_8_um_filter_43_34]PJA44750.1 MAG: malate dehydrogenase [Verrucomicrobia bacterium CG_4_9_14_3_um_filter_43_20]